MFTLMVDNPSFFFFILPEKLEAKQDEKQEYEGVGI